MKPQNCLFSPALLLLTSTLSLAFDIKCSKYDSDQHAETITCNAPSEYCGIDRFTGAIQGCVPASQCPATVSDNRIIVCDASKSSCCCLDSSGDKDEIDCNDILNSEDDSQWKEACKIGLLQSPAEVCKVNPKRRVYCAFKDYNPNGDPRHPNTYSGRCRPFEFCGIAKGDGEMKKCLPAKECPSSGAKGSKQVVCDGSASHCCCQDIVERSEEASRKPCNYILNEDDSTIWQQACSLKELSPLSVCQEDPSKQVYCKKGTDPGRVSCKPSQFCGIDQNTGELKECLDASQCPSSVSEQISCDPSKPFCCCQKVEDKHGHGRASPCNDMLNPRDNTIWNQACSLIELTFLPICKEDPTKAVFCSDNGDRGPSVCGPSQFCGIDKTEGKLKQCLDASECPSGAGGSDIVCDDNTPNCCCRNIVDSYTRDLDSCNNIFDEDHPSIWEQACEKEQLKNLSICQHDPTKKAVYCKHDDYGGVNYVGCPPFQFCGIDKSNGQVKGCLFANECPAGAGGSEKIVCDDSAPNCCCQKIDDKSRYSFEEQPTCNNILDLENTTIWKQACALEQLKDLEVCKAPPTKPTFRPNPKPKPGGIHETDETEEHELQGWEIALIVISVLMVLVVIVCVVFIFYKKRRRNVVGQGGAVQGQQQIPSNLDAQQQLVGSYYPAQQGYNLQASQSAPLVPVNPAYQNPYAMSMPNMRYY